MPEPAPRYRASHYFQTLQTALLTDLGGQLEVSGPGLPVRLEIRGKVWMPRKAFGEAAGAELGQRLASFVREHRGQVPDRTAHLTIDLSALRSEKGRGSLSVMLRPASRADELPGDGLTIRLRVAGDSGRAEGWVELYSHRDEQRSKGHVSKETDERTEFLRAVLEELLGSLPSGYSARRTALAELSDVFRDAIARALEPALNEHLKAMPQATYDDKKDLAKYVNAELRRFGLALRSRKTDHPTLLRCDPGRQMQEGRFQLDYIDAEGRRHRPENSSKLPYLNLMVDDLTRVPYGERSHRQR